MIKSVQVIIFSFLVTISHLAFSLSNNMTNIEPGHYALVGAGISRMSEPSLFSNSKNNLEKIKFSPALVFNAQFGYRINRLFRADLNAQYRRVKIKSPETIKSLKINNYTASVNGYLDFKNVSHLTPYLTAGVGFSMLHIKKNKDDTTAQSSNSNGILFNIGAGTQIQISDRFGIDIYYKYLDLGKLKVKHDIITKSPNVGTHEILINFLMIL